MTGSYQYGFMKGKSRLTNLIAFCDEITSLVDKERAEHVNHLDFSKAVITGCHSILINKLLTRCPGFSWDRVNCLPSSWYGAMF